MRERLTYERLPAAAAAVLREVGCALGIDELLLCLEDKYEIPALGVGLGLSLAQRMARDPLQRFRYDRAARTWSLTTSGDRGMGGA